MKENHTMITYLVKMFLKDMKQGFEILVVGSFPFASATISHPVLPPHTSQEHLLPLADSDSPRDDFLCSGYSKCCITKLITFN